jgi:ribose transport system permease protein
MTNITSAANPSADFAILDEKASFFRRASKAQTLQIALFLFIITSIFSALSPDAFFTGMNLRNVVINVSSFMILGVGMTFVIITAGIDLSVGSVLVFSTVVASKTIIAMGGQGWGATGVGFVVCMVAGVGFGALKGWLIAVAGVPAFIVTLGTLSTALGISQIITGGIDLRVAPDVLVNNIGYGNVYKQIPVLGVITIVVVLVGGILLHKTKFGLHTNAVGSNIEGCRRVGINVNRHLIKVYSLMGFTSALAGFLSLAVYQQTTIAGQSQTALTVVAGVVIGGTSLFGGYGTMVGTTVGLLIPIVLQTGFIIIGVVPFWQNVVVGIFLVAAVYLDSVRRSTAEKGGGRHKKRSSSKSTK